MIPEELMEVTLGAKESILALDNVYDDDAESWISLRPDPYTADTILGRITYADGRAARFDLLVRVLSTEEAA